jgi:hypothetical protein
MTMTLAEALALADHASPLPHLAGEALRVLRAELERVHNRSLPTPADWKVVPLHPTDSMLRAAQDAWLADPLRRTTTIWSAMLAAAPNEAVNA